MHNGNSCVGAQHCCSQFAQTHNFSHRSISMRRILFFLLIFALSTTSLSAQQKLSVHWEELTAADFTRAIEQSKGTCILPIGILEKHGPHLPLGTDLLNVRYASL